MKFILSILFTLIIDAYSVLPTWNIRTSPIDLLDGKTSYTYVIDQRNWWYDASDNFTKTIKNTGGKITHENTFVMYDLHWANVKFRNTVQFEAIESFYANTNSNTDVPLVCPRGNYNPLKITSSSTITELSNGQSNWKKTDKFDLKCYYHRSNGGQFLVYYLMNDNNFLLELKSSNFETVSKFSIDVDEIYDFKLINKKTFEGAETGPYPFMALVKKGEYLRIVGAKMDFFASSQTISNYKDLIKIKNHTQAYFHVFHYNNDFYYFTYNDVYDFTSGYSTTSITAVEDATYDQCCNSTK